MRLVDVYGRRLRIFPSSTALSHRSNEDQFLESAVDQALAVERHRLRIHHVGQSRVLHDLGVDTIAMRARLVHDVREHHGFAGLELDASREGGELPDLHVVADPLLILEGAKFLPYFSCLLGHAPIGPQIFSRYRYYKTINVAHIASRFDMLLQKTARMMRT